jgi:hypothetical protein
MRTKLSIEAFAEEAAESIVNGNMSHVHDSIVRLSKKEAVAVTAVVSTILGEHDRGLYLRFVDYTVSHA